MWFQMMSMGKFGSFLSVPFILGFWKCHYDIWFCLRIIMIQHMCAYMGFHTWEAYMGFQMMSRGTLGSFMPVLFKVGFWKWHLDTKVEPMIILGTLVHWLV